MYVPDQITDQIKNAKTRKEVLEIILEECFQEELQEAKEKYEYSKKHATFLYRKLPKEVKTFF